MNKRANETVMSEIVLVIASVIVFSIIMVFVVKASTSSLYYEEIYAKKIGLSIEASSPGTVLEFDISEAYLISKKNKLFKDNFEGSFKSEFFYFNETDNSVTVKMSDSGGFKFNLMTNKILETSIVNINDNSQVLLIEVGGENE